MSKPRVYFAETWYLRVSSVLLRQPLLFVYWSFLLLQSLRSTCLRRRRLQCRLFPDCLLSEDISFMSHCWDYHFLGQSKTDISGLFHQVNFLCDAPHVLRNLLPLLLKRKVAMSLKQEKHEWELPRLKESHRFPVSYYFLVTRPLWISFCPVELFLMDNYL